MEEIRLREKLNLNEIYIYNRTDRRGITVNKFIRRLKTIKKKNPVCRDGGKCFGILNIQQPRQTPRYSEKVEKNSAINLGLNNCKVKFTFYCW